MYDKYIHIYTEILRGKIKLRLEFAVTYSNNKKEGREGRE